ncbi:MAG: serine protease [bacterium]|nr:serine protease [bacterium]
MKKIILVLSIAIILSQPLAALALTLTNQDVSGVVQITSRWSENSVNQQIRSLAGLYTDEELQSYRQELVEQELLGSGFFVTYSGCVLTNKHVIYDIAVGSAHTDIHLWSTDRINAAPRDLGQAEIVYTRTLDDIAVVCLKQTRGQFFNRLFVKTPDYNDLNLTLGEEIYTLGYPVNGGEYPTLTKGIIAGAWDDHTLKTDMAITSGGSGSPVLNANKQVIGIAQGNTGPFDQLGLFLDPSFVINWHEGYEQVYRELIKDSVDCSNSDLRGVYQKQDQQYYDLSCKEKRNIGLEMKITADYKNICQADLRQEDAAAAAVYINSGKSTLENWQSYLETTCLGWPLQPVILFSASDANGSESEE